MKVLIADDDVRIRRVLRLLLVGLADDVYEACEGGEAIAVCAAQHPDWVIMDISMKPLDGLRATEQIKSRWPEVRIIIFTQYDEPELRAEAMRLGAEAYVLKEDLYDLHDILSTVKSPEPTDDPLKRNSSRAEET